MITVHYLKVGRPLFTVWLLEELGLDYELNVFLRHPKTMRAPDELKQIHPLGKSPVIEDGDLKLAESGAITSYLIDTYDQPGNLSPDCSDVAARAQYSQWLHYSEGSAFTPLLLSLLVMRAGEPSPKLISHFAQSEVTLHLDYISGFLGDKPFLLGDRFKRRRLRPGLYRLDGEPTWFADRLPVATGVSGKGCRKAGIQTRRGENRRKGRFLRTGVPRPWRARWLALQKPYHRIGECRGLIPMNRMAGPRDDLVPKIWGLGE